MKSSKSKKINTTSALNVSKSVGQRMKNTFIRTKAKAEQQIREQEKLNNTSPADYAENALADKVRTGTDKAGRLLNRQGKKTVRNLPKTLRSGKQAIKIAQKSIKTAKQGQAAAKTAQKAAKASRASAKATVKAIGAAVKAAISAVKGTVALIAAGGWVAVVIIVLICAVGLVAAFWSDGSGGMPDIPSDMSVSSIWIK